MSRGGDPVQQDDTERLPIVLELIAMTATVATSEHTTTTTIWRILRNETRTKKKKLKEEIQQ